MPVQLGQSIGLSQFTPEVQQQMFERGIKGIDLTNGFPRREPNPEYVEKIRTLENVYDMVQRGDLVPKENIRPVQSYPSYQEPVVQNVPVIAQNEPQIQNNSNESGDDLMKMLFPESVVAQPQAPVQQQVQQPTPIKNEQPKINWEEVVYEQQNMLRSEAVKNGVAGEEVMGWMEKLTPKDYVDMYRMFNSNRQNVPVQTQPKPTNINWGNNNQRQILPSIADLPGSNVAVVQRDNARPSHPFGLNGNGY